MSIFKCKMCGGTIEFEQGATVGVCDSCGTKQTLPRLDDDKKTNLYDRANHFRRNNDFDKAMGIYEQILNEDNTDAEAYWSLVLCRYGIEYVEDPATHKRVPTVNRAQYTSIFADEDYKSALQYADGYQKSIYEEEAKAIDEIQKGILEISSKEEPFDVFVCYKETDANGRRTPDSVLATELYHELTKEGFKVFFSRITLEDKLGTAYEPYIFAALNSAKVMVVLGTKPEYFNAVWVKNEWSRYLALIKNGAKKMLIPAYRDMDPYDLPEEFSHLQAQDMSKLGFMQDLIRGIKKIIAADAPRAPVRETTIVSANNTNPAPLLKRAFMFLEDGAWQDADEYCEKVLDQDPENAQAYLGKLMAELRIHKRDELPLCESSFEDNQNYIKALRFADSGLKNQLEQYVLDFKTAAEEKKQLAIATEANQLLQTGKKADAAKAKELFQSLKNEADKTNGLAKCEAAFEAIERKETEDKTAAAKQAKQRKKIGIIAGTAVAVVVAVILVVTQIILPANATKRANELLNAGEYQVAYETLQSRKETEALDRCRYRWANALLVDDTEKAVELYKEIEEPKNIAGEDLEQGYKNAFALLDKHDPANAQVLFELLEDYESSSQYAEYCAAYIDASESGMANATAKYSRLPKDFMDTDARIQFFKKFTILESLASGYTYNSEWSFDSSETHLGVDGLHVTIKLTDKNGAIIYNDVITTTVMDFEKCIKDGYISAIAGARYNAKIYNDRIEIDNPFDGKQIIKP